MPAQAELQAGLAQTNRRHDLEVWLGAFREVLSSGNGVGAVAALRDAVTRMDAAAGRGSSQNNPDAPLTDQELSLFVSLIVFTILVMAINSRLSESVNGLYQACGRGTRGGREG